MRPGLVAHRSDLPRSGDHDLLPTPRDPDPTYCNKLLYEQTFLATPNWTEVNATWSWTKGWMTQPFTQNGLSGSKYCWGRAQDATLNTTAYLVEARLRLGPISNTSYWKVGIVARLSSTFSGADLIPARTSSSRRRSSRQRCRRRLTTAAGA